MAISVAIARPEQVSAVVMLSPAFDRLPAQLARLVVDLPLERPSFIAAGLRDWWRVGPRRLLAMARAAARSPLDELVGAVRCPVLVVRGARDPLTTGRWATELAGRARRAASRSSRGRRTGWGTRRRSRSRGRSIGSLPRRS